MLLLILLASDLESLFGDKQILIIFKCMSLRVKSRILCKIIYVSLWIRLIDPLFCFMRKINVLSRTGLPFIMNINED